MEGNIGEFGELSVIRQTKTIQISTYNYLLADLLIRQMLKTNQFANVTAYEFNTS